MRGRKYAESQRVLASCFAVYTYPENNHRFLDVELISSPGSPKNKPLIREAMHASWAVVSCTQSNPNNTEAAEVAAKLSAGWMTRRLPIQLLKKKLKQRRWKRLARG